MGEGSIRKPCSKLQGITSSKYLKDSKEISVTGETLKHGTYFMGQQEIISDGGFKYNASSLDEAKYIIYSQKPNSFLIKIKKKQRY